jgi:Carbohydrate family 9 binding domain-like
MNGLASLFVMTALLSGLALAQDHGTIESVQAEKDAALTLDPSSAFWRGSQLIHVEQDRMGKVIPQSRAEVRTRWTKNNLYFLFACPYEELYLKPDPKTKEETNKLWDWDVAEVFIGSDFENIRRYKEFEVSPQGEWVDLDIDLNKPHHEEGWRWNSGFESSARIGPVKHVWYAAMRIPFSAIDARPPIVGNTLRINLFVSQGPPKNHREVTWRAPMKETFHVPERFGLIRLVAKQKR